MLDIGISKLMLVAGIALVVIGPERLPKVARMAGTLLGRAQRYVADVKAEVNRSMELDELNKVRREFETAARDVGQSVSSSLDSATGQINAALSGPGSTGTDDDGAPTYEPYEWDSSPAVPTYVHPRKKWRVKRGAIPQWYKQREGVRRHVQSGAARVARFRPPRRSV
ncbi:sec-independent translocase [Sphaerotilus natans subsp. natans DSM 6575]|jgi:sec-independent protein translocase protein TatB|uniref:Sec-independent protein translocase protein TatB n=1 Tax=Sphaerotilus natans subsp. natans DSM 6575 TaxID=1286631 RepID=A0A059KLB1_9BURK|nr:Sec-independent protein translocase protein TatB [Sphaerotilus natans]KDB52140.1 sec-independent translocase [Sphaerotilus natans subsp. natans DSM 6575]SIQ41782.1 sec-independent protein translocase protein TatB [Sphaerotilus natans]